MRRQAGTSDLRALVYVDVAAWDARLGGPGKREFVLKSAASGEPRLFTSRWAMSYLRGPLTRPEIVRLQAARDRKAQAERRVRELETHVGTRRQQEVVAGAGEILTLFLGGRRRIRSLSGAASRRAQTVRTQQHLRSAAEKMEDHDEAIRALEDELAQELQAGWTRWEDAARPVSAVEIPLEKTEVRVEEMLLFWG